MLAQVKVCKELQRRRKPIWGKGNCRVPSSPTLPHVGKLALPIPWPLVDYRVEDTRSSEIVSKVLHIHGQGILLTNAESISHYSGRHKQKETFHQLSTQRNLESGLTG